MTGLDSITKELAEIQAQLLQLPADAYAERFELHSRQDRLRKEASKHGHELDKERPRADIEAELRSQRHRLEALLDSRSGYATGMGGSNQGPGSAEMASLTLRAKRAANAEPILARIAYLERLLATREPPT